MKKILALQALKFSEAAVVMVSTSSVGCGIEEDLVSNCSVDCGTTTF